MIAELIVATCMHFGPFGLCDYWQEPPVPYYQPYNQPYYAYPPSYPWGQPYPRHWHPEHREWRQPNRYEHWRDRD